MKKFLGLLAVLLVCFTLTATTTSFAATASTYYTPAESLINSEQRQELRDIWDKYPVEPQYANLAATRGESIGSCGDILLALDSAVDHVGIVKNSKLVIEAHPDNPNGLVAYRDNDWTIRYDHIKGLRVDGASTTNKLNAVSYAAAQIGEPYGLATTHWTEDTWYCSKLVWRAWYNQGYDIEGRTYEPRGTHITPGDILDSPLTSVFYTFDS